MFHNDTLLSGGGTAAALAGDRRRSGVSGAVVFWYPAIRPGKPLDAQGKRTAAELNISHSIMNMALIPGREWNNQSSFDR